MKQNRDEKGRFVAEIKDDAENIVNFCYLLYRLLPLFIIGFALFKYYDLSNFLYSFGQILTCGKNCRCVCDNGNFVTDVSGNTKGNNDF